MNNDDLTGGPEEPQYDANLGVGSVEDVEVSDGQYLASRRRRRMLFTGTVLVAGAVAAGAVLDNYGVVDFSELYGSARSYFSPAESVQVVAEAPVEKVPLVHTLPYTEFKGTVGDGSRVEIYPLEDSFELRLKTDDGCRILYSNGNDLRDSKLVVDNFESYAEKCFSNDRYDFTVEDDLNMYADATRALDVLVADVQIYHTRQLYDRFCGAVGSLVKNCGTADVERLGSGYAGVKRDVNLVLGSDSGTLSSGVVIDVSSLGRMNILYTKKKIGTVDVSFTFGDNNEVQDLTFTYRPMQGDIILATNQNPETKFEFYENDLAVNLGNDFISSIVSDLESGAVQKRQEIAAESARVAAIEEARVKAHKEAAVNEFSAIIGN